MRILNVLPLLIAAGCSSGIESGHQLGEFEAFTEAVELLTENHVTAVEASTSMEAVDVLEAEYAANWSVLSDEMNTIQDELEQCDMADGMMGHMDRTRDAIDTMMAEMSAHADAHANRSDFSECIAAEGPHESIMMDAVQECLDAHDAMHDGFDCDGRGMGM